MGEMRRAIAREEQERAKAMEQHKQMTDRFASTLVIAASIIAAVRLARASVIGLNPAIRDRVKSGHREWPKT
jgi:hypothetical protein